MTDDNVKKFVDLEGLAYFLEKFKYAMANNDNESTDNNNTPEN